MLVAAAAATVLVAGGVSHALTTGPETFANRNPVTAAAGLTAVNGCSGLDATSGTLEQVNGTSLVLTTSGGQPVTVTTSASTNVSRQVTESLSDITDGASVIVHGTNSKGTIAARSVSVGVPNLRRPPNSSKPVSRRPRPGSFGFAAGTVADASTSSFTVVTFGGTHVRVTTSSSTTVSTLESASLSQLQTGEFTVAVGSAGPNGTLAATTVEQGADLSRIQHGSGIFNLPGLGCSSSVVATAALVSAG